MSVSTNELVYAFKQLPTTVITDVMDRFGTADPEIGPVWQGAAFCGVASTVWTREGDNQGIHEFLRGDILTGCILVVAGGGFKNRALLGDLIAERAVNAGIAGIVVDGAIRDVPGIEEAGIPVFARSVSSAGPYKSGPFRLGEPVSIGGVVVNNGDIICGDSEGVVVVPRHRAEEVLSKAQEKLQNESKKRQSLISTRS